MDVLVRGVALGSASIIKNEDNNNDCVNFLDAIKLSLEQIEQMKSENSDCDYLDIQKLLISDPIFKSEVLEYISNGYKDSLSVKLVLDKYINELKNSDNLYMQERSLDLEDIKERILTNISGNSIYKMNDKKIVIVDELHPSFLIQNRKYIAGVIARKGGYTSHSTILCNEYLIPYVVSLDVINDGDFVIIDNDKLFVNPNLDIVDKYNYNQNLNKLCSHENVNIYANVSSNYDLNLLKELGFDGVGLYRTEFLFMDDPNLFSLNNQLKLYQKANSVFSFVNFRCFDVGDDKQLAFIKVDNKGVNNYLNNINEFKLQLEAFKLANVKNIMFPMIKTINEYNLLKSYIDFDCSVGMMLETKEALDNIYDFKDVDFISIGTNDLILDVYGIKRDQQFVDLSYIDDLLLRISNVVSFCLEFNIKLSICGEILGLEDVLYRLFEIGIRNISISVSKIDIVNKVYKKFFE